MKPPIHKAVLGAAAVLLLLVPAAHAWKKHGVPTGYDFTVTFDSLAANSRYDLAAQNSVFTDPAVLSPFNLDSGATAYQLFTIIDASGFPGTHAKALQTLFPYASLGGNMYAPNCPSAPCPITGYGSYNWWGFGLADNSTLNLEFDVLFETGFDFRYVAGKIGPHIIVGTGGFTASETTRLKLWWRASDNTTDCPRVAWPTLGGGGSGLCLTFFMPVYEDPGGFPVNPTGQTTTSWGISTNKWYHWKLQYHKGCPSDNVVGCVDFNYHKIWGPTSNSDTTPFLYINHVSTLAEGNADTRANYYPGIDVAQWFGGGDVDSAEAAGSATPGSGSFIVYDNIRVWSGTGP